MTLIDFSQTPNEDSVAEVMRWLQRHGYAVIVWTPGELDDVLSQDEMEEICIVAGNNALADRAS